MNNFTEDPKKVPYRHQDYPGWRYHATLPAKIVPDAAEDEKATLAGYTKTPPLPDWAEPVPPEAPPPAAPASTAKLLRKT